jgi:hypothetical protein
MKEHCTAAAVLFFKLGFIGEMFPVPPVTKRVKGEALH